MNTAKPVVAVTLAVAFLVTAASLLLPVPDTWHFGALNLHNFIGQSLLFTLVTIGAATLFLMGLDGFKAKLKVAYSAIAVGVILAAAALAQLPVATFWDLWDTFYFKAGVAAVPFLIGALAQYFGIRLWAQQLQIKSWAMNWGWALLFVAVGMILFTQLPHVAATSLPERDLDLKLTIYAWAIAFSILCIILLLHLRNLLSKTYVKAQTWLLWGLALNAMAFVAGTWTELLGFSSSELWRPLNLADEFLVVASFCYLRTGYLFNRIGSYAEAQQSAPFIPQRSTSTEEVTMFDVVTFIADMASDPSKIDSSLDEMRRISAQHLHGEPLSDDDIATLVRTFHKIEIYLTTQEAVRNFTPQTLRQLVEQKFTPDVCAPFFLGSDTPVAAPPQSSTTPPLSPEHPAV